MSKINETWTVQEHGPVTELADGLVTVQGSIKMPLGNFPRRMTVARGNAGAVVYSAIALRDADMQRIEALGAPAFLIVPNAHHRLDAKAWKARYPAIKVIAPSGARESIEEVVPVDATNDILCDPQLELETIGGTQARELALIVKRPNDTTLVVNDIIAHVAHPDGVGARIMARLMGFGVREPQIPSVAKMTLVKDKTALAGQFRRWSAMPDLRRIVVSHGDVIERPRETLETLASALV